MKRWIVIIIALIVLLFLLPSWSAAQEPQPSVSPAAFISGGEGARPASQSLPAPIWELDTSFGKDQDKKQPTIDETSVVAAGWQTIKHEDFELAFPNSKWTLLDLSNDGYERLWDETDADNYPPAGDSGGHSAWPANGGADGIDPPGGTYPNNMNSWMIYGPFDLSNASDVQTVFYLRRAIEPNYDFIFFGYSGDGINFNGWKWDGSEDWIQLDAHYPSLLGDNTVWVGWNFQSDGSVGDFGPYIDQITISKNVQPQIDLEVTDISTPPQPICAGSSPNFLASIRNNGSTESGFFDIQWNRDGQLFVGGQYSIPAGAIHQNGFLWENVPQGQHTMTFTADYDNQIAESNENNNQKTITFTAVNCSPPAAPSNVQATPTDSTHIRLAWKDNSNNETGFYISDGVLSEATVGANTTSHTMGGLDPGSYHCYHIYAFNSYGNSAWSDWTCTSTLPAAPVADFDAWPLSGNAPLTVRMHSNASGTITSCKWNYGDGTTGNSCDGYHDHTYTAAGSYSVRLTVSGPGGSNTKTRNNYITVSAPPTYPISGRVVNLNNNGISGVAITATGPINKSTTTNSSGNYTLNGLAAGTYTITSSKSGYAFSPPSRTLSVPPNATGMNFTGTPIPPPDTTPPAAVTNLASAPGNGAGQLILSWTAPGDDGAAGGPAAQYDIRYSNAPINSSNWVNAAQISGEPTPATPASTQQMFVPNLPTGTRWYFAVKTYDEANNPSNLSNVPSVKDSGFRPNPQGYQFSNGDDNWGGYPHPPADGDYTRENMRKMFGDGAVCWGSGSVCSFKPQAEKWLKEVNDMMNSGHCLGMSVTSLRFFTGPDSPADFPGGASTVHDLMLANARRNIAYYHVEQRVGPIEEYIASARQKSLSDTVTQLYSGLSGRGTDPLTLFMIKPDLTQAHAVTPYATADNGSGVNTVWVYDNNWPDSITRTIKIDMTLNVWLYDSGIKPQPLWTGTDQSHRLGIISNSIFSTTLLDTPWSIPSTSGEIWFASKGHLLITNSRGKRIGYIGNQFINEIPNASASPIIGGLSVSSEPIYAVPLANPYTILLDGQTLNQSETVEVTQFGPGYAGSVENISLKPSSKDELTIAPDGTQLNYRASETKSPTLILARDNASESYQFEIMGADIGAGKVVALTVNNAQGRVSFSNANAGGGTYDLRIKRVRTTGAQTFLHANLTVLGGDTHYVDYGSWDGSGSMILYIDHGSNGTIDQTVELENQVPRIYLPLIIR